MQNGPEIRLRNFLEMTTGSDFLAENGRLMMAGLFVALFILVVISAQDEAREILSSLRNRFRLVGKKQPRLLRSLGRFAAFLLLCTLTWALGSLASNAFWAIKDSWVAPIHFSPDSDEVIETHLRVHERLEKMSLLRSRLGTIENDLKGKRLALSQLTRLQNKLYESMDWTAKNLSKFQDVLKKNTKLLGKERTLTGALRKSQALILSELQREFEAGLMSKVDYHRQAQIVNQIRLQESEAERNELEKEFEGTQAGLQSSGWEMERQELFFFFYNSISCFRRYLPSITKY